MSRLESSNWLSFVQNSLNAACLVAQCLDQEGASVLVHGTNGFDSTLLVTSIAQVILNPDCRTVRGTLFIFNSHSHSYNSLHAWPFKIYIIL